jgi:transcription elongation factor GreA
MPNKQFFVTKEGLLKLEQELEKLRSSMLSEVADKIQRAKERGGTENNAEYEDAKNELAFIEGRILTLESNIKKASVIDSTHSKTKVTLGSRVLLRDQDGKVEQYQIVGSAESNPITGFISNESPVGKTLLGKSTGDTVNVSIPAGKLQLHIIEIS